MSGEVIPFARPDKNPKAGGAQHSSGEAFCMQCDHLWTAIAPTGTVELECPNCLTMKGLYRWPHAFGDLSQLVRRCDCGNQLFYLTPEGHLCPNCGKYQSY